MTRILLAYLFVLAAAAVEPVAAKAGLDDPGQPAAFQPRDGVVVVDISEYAGYAGLIAANRGLDPSPDSFFAKQYGFQVRIRLSESENWKPLNAGEIAATVSTADVLPLLGSRIDAVVPALIGYSRGADGVIVRSDLRSINDLAGKVVAAAQFTESDFLLRYLAQEAGVEVAALAAPDAAPRAGVINLLFAEDGFAAGDLFAEDLAAGRGRIAGCVTWAPKTGEVVAASAGQARQMISNRNLLVVADVLVVNGGLARSSPRIVDGLVHGLLEGNRLVRGDPATWLPVVAKAFGWDDARTKAELGKVHLANRAENLAFLDGSMDAAGSFQYIYQSAALVYGDAAKDADPARLVDARALRGLEKPFAGDKVEIRPETAGAAQVEPEAVVKRSVRFLFDANTTRLDASDQLTRENLDRIGQWLRAGPGSRVVLVGHVEPTQRAELEKANGRMKAAMMARKLGQERADEVRRVLVETRQIAADRITTASRGWEQPIPDAKDPALNRRVEVQWKIPE
jgi:NitT/TauT family transport system substrate-binding protein